MQVIIIGGGASGLMAAITAARNGHAVTLLERQVRVGRKLLATGNGRCNLTNLNMTLPCYHGQSPEFIRPAFAALDRDATYDIVSGDYTIHLQVQNGAIRFVDSPCPDHLCENFGWLSRAGDWAACLPAKASLTLLEPDR